jgi:hypothetical protein
MPAQIKPSVTNPTIADIYEKIDADKLDLAPDFQRKFVWTQDHQESFLDTILQGYPFPEIYVCQGTIDTVKMKITQKVIDGQQRLTTIKNYIEDSFEKPLKSIKKFSELTERERENFLSYQVVVRDIGKVEDSLVREIFRRINLTKFKLEDIEIHNAIYDGQFIQIGKTIAKEIKLEKYGVFHESEFTRMADLHFVLQVMSTLEVGGYYNGDSEIEKCIAEYNDEYKNSQTIQEIILRTFAIVEKLDLPLDSIWLRKSNFFTMIIELSKLNIDIDIDIEILKGKLEILENQIMVNKSAKENDFGNYYSYMYAGTNSRKARIVRSELFRKHVLEDPNVQSAT